MWKLGVGERGADFRNNQYENENIYEY